MELSLRLLSLNAGNADTYAEQIAPSDTDLTGAQAASLKLPIPANVGKSLLSLSVSSRSQIFVQYIIHSFFRFVKSFEKISLKLLNGDNALKLCDLSHHRLKSNLSGSLEREYSAGVSSLCRILGYLKVDYVAPALLDGVNHRSEI